MTQDTYELTRRITELTERAERAEEVADTIAAIHKEQIATITGERDEARLALADAADQIPCAGPIAHRIRKLKELHVAQIEHVVKERDRFTRELEAERERITTLEAALEEARRALYPFITFGVAKLVHNDIANARATYERIGRLLEGKK